MKRAISLLAVLACGLSVAGAAAVAGDDTSSGARPHKRMSHSVRRKPQVRGYVARRGGYSYSQVDAINTYGDSGHAVAPLQFRDPRVERQSGPFDNGFFYDSGILPRGGNSPYMN